MSGRCARSSRTPGERSTPSSKRSTMDARSNSPTIDTDHSIDTDGVEAALDRIALSRGGPPASSRMDNRPEFVTRAHRRVPVPCRTPQRSAGRRVDRSTAWSGPERPSRTSVEMTTGSGSAPPATTSTRASSPADGPPTHPEPYSSWTTHRVDLGALAAPWHAQAGATDRQNDSNVKRIHSSLSYRSPSISGIRRPKIRLRTNTVNVNADTSPRTQPAP